MQRNGRYRAASSVHSVRERADRIVFALCCRDICVGDLIVIERYCCFDHVKTDLNQLVISDIG